MPILTVLEHTEPRAISFQPGTPIRNILDTTDLRVRSGCRGNGTCGFCRIQIQSVEIPPTRAESFHLSEAELQAGIHLACQVIPADNLAIHIVNPAPHSAWRSLAAEEYYQPHAQRSVPKTGLPNSTPSLGCAVDLGTTNIGVTLWDLQRSQRLTGRAGANQQSLYGADVMTRLVAACESPERARDLSSLAIDSIWQALYDICSREAYNSWQISRVTLVGNTAELALLAEKNFALLLQPAYWTRPIDCQPTKSQSWASDWNIHPQVEIQLIDPLAGFVGSDLLAGVLATGIACQSHPSLLIDFGTNTEIAVWDGANLWVTSAAGGPAFEASGLSCGVPASPGAIYRIQTHADTLNYEVLPGAPAQGLCGSAIIDLIAELMRDNRLNHRGKFSGSCGDVFQFRVHDRGFALTSHDVDLFQRAKAAIGAGVCLVARAAGISMRDLKQVCVCGAFGRYLDVANAIAVGLLPDVAVDLIELCGNTALAGCEMLLTAPERARELDRLRQQARLINLSNQSDFEEMFLNNLYLKPMVTN